MSQHIERIDAWTCSNAYACVPFFTHTARAFRVISLEDWVLELRFSNLRVKFAKQEVKVSIIFITSPIPGLTSRPFNCLWFLSCPKPDTRICDHDRHTNIKFKPDINKNQLNSYKTFTKASFFFFILVSLLK